MKGKETTMHDVEGMIYERLDILQNGKTQIEKKKARSEIIKLERHIRDVNSKYYNGHKYPERMKGFPDDKPMDKKEVLKLIDSVPDEQHRNWEGLDTQDYDQEIDLSGVSVGKNIFEYVDKGWSKPKEMKPAPFFK